MVLAGPHVWCICWVSRYSYNESFSGVKEVQVQCIYSSAALLTCASEVQIR